MSRLAKAVETENRWVATKAGEDGKGKESSS